MDDLLVLLILQYLQLLTCLLSAIGYWSTHACVINYSSQTDVYREHSLWISYCQVVIQSLVALQQAETLPFDHLRLPHLLFEDHDIGTMVHR